MQESKRLAEISFLPIEDIYSFLCRMNQTADLFDRLELQNDSYPQILIHNKKVGLTTHIPYLIDPITRAVLLAQAIYGTYWTKALPDYLVYVDQQWKEVKKLSKNKTKESL